MAEPTTSGASGAALVALAASLVGAKYGPVVTVGTAALIGAFISLGEVVTAGGRLHAVRYVVQYTAAACMVAGSVSYLIERYTHIPQLEVLVLVAFVIGWVGGRWRALLESLLAAAQKLIGRGAPTTKR
jgi:hypothetical protein